MLVSTPQNQALRQWSPLERNIFLALFIVGLASKGLALARGFSTDDYLYTTKSFIDNRDYIFSEGRLIGWLALAAIEKLGFNIVDCGFIFGIVAVAIQSAFAVYAMRFVGVFSFPVALACGGIIALHPYAAEIFSFKIAFAGYSLCLFLVICAIESARKRAFSLKGLLVVNAYIISALLVYQIAFNHILAVALGGILAALLSRPINLEGSRRKMSASLLLITGLFSSSIFYVFLLKALRHVGIIGAQSSRSMLIPSDEIAGRVLQILRVLRLQYLRSEPILHTPLKLLLLVAVLIAAILIIARLCTIYGWLNAGLLTVLLGLIWGIASIGVIIPFQQWHPVPRVFSHFSTLIGLTLLNSFNYAAPRNGTKLIRRVLVGLCGFIVFGYALAGNQIFADQVRVNQWDAMLANRIAGRLESLPGYEGVTKLEIYGGAMNFERALNTTQVDMNISAFSKSWSKGAILTEATGKKYSIEIKDSAPEALCKSVWPEKDSIFITGETAVVCLPSQVMR